MSSSSYLFLGLAIGDQRSQGHVDKRLPERVVRLVLAMAYPLDRGLVRTDRSSDHRVIQPSVSEYGNCLGWLHDTEDMRSRIVMSMHFRIRPDKR